METQSEIQCSTMNLWPDAGKRLGLGKNAIYEAAARNQVPGLFRIGSRWLVSIEAFNRAMKEPPATAATARLGAK